jgi:hypothetical protein
LPGGAYRIRVRASRKQRSHGLAIPSAKSVWKPLGRLHALSASSIFKSRLFTRSSSLPPSMARVFAPFKLLQTSGTVVPGAIWRVVIDRFSEYPICESISFIRIDHQAVDGK